MKAAVSARPPLDESAAPALAAYFQAKGLLARPSEPQAGLVWATGTRGACRVRVADVAPEGWWRAIVADAARGETLAYAFEGRFYSDQPVLRTRLAEYRRRMVRYLGMAAPPLAVRAVIVSPACPAEIMTPADAALLSPVAG